VRARSSEAKASVAAFLAAATSSARKRNSTSVSKASATKTMSAVDQAKRALKVRSCTCLARRSTSVGWSRSAALVFALAMLMATP
jgi:hypothetical protein